MHIFILKFIIHTCKGILMWNYYLRFKGISDKFGTGIGYNSFILEMNLKQQVKINFYFGFGLFLISFMFVQLQSSLSFV